MGGRRKPNWVVFVGGPFDGERLILYGQGDGLTIRYAPSATPGMVLPNEYLVTSERRKGAFHEGTARAALFVRTLPEKPAPPPRPLPPAHSTPRSGHREVAAGYSGAWASTPPMEPLLRPFRVQRRGLAGGAFGRCPRARGEPAGWP